MGKISDALNKAGYKDGVELPEVGEAASDQPSEIETKEVSARKLKSLDSKKKINLESVSEGSGKWDERLLRSVNEDKEISEIFSALRSRILHPIDGRPVPKTLMVTSAMPNEGKSFIAANIAISFAHGMDQHALLVDCDLRKPSLASLFGLFRETGLVDYLRDTKSLPQIICKTSVNKLSMVPSGKPPINPSELLSSGRMIDLVDELANRYEDRTIIIDSPPALAAAESLVLAKQVDGVVVVVRQGKSNKAQVQKVLDLMATGKVIGLVFNDYKTNYLDKTYMGGAYNYTRSDEG